MKRMSRQEQLLLKSRRPPGLDEPEIKLFVRPINLIAYNRIASRGQMHTNLMSAAGERNSANQTEFVVAASGFGEAPFNTKFSLRRRSRRMNRVLQPDGGPSMFTLSI